jgi:hypothetical protein
MVKTVSPVVGVRENVAADHTDLLEINAKQDGFRAASAARKAKAMHVGTRRQRILER